MGHHTPLSVVEQFGIVDALHPHRIDLGLGRSRLPPRRRRRRRRATASAHRTAEGLLIPAPFSFARLLGSPRFALQGALLQQPGAETPDYVEQVDDVLALLAGTYRDDAGTEAHVVPGEGATLDVWILGSSGGVSAVRRRRARAAVRRQLPRRPERRARGDRRLPRRVPAERRARRAVRRGVGRRRRRPDRRRGARAGDRLRAVGAQHPHRRGGDPVPDARRGPPPRVDRRRPQRSSRTASTPSSSARRSTVADQLEVLAAATGADELLLTTITHDHADRVRSYELIAAEWSTRRPPVLSFDSGPIGPELKDRSRVPA